MYSGDSEMREDSIALGEADGPDPGEVATDPVGPDGDPGHPSSLV